MTSEDEHILACMTNISFKEILILRHILYKKKIITKQDFNKAHKYIFGEKKEVK